MRETHAYIRITCKQLRSFVSIFFGSHCIPFHLLIEHLFRCNQSERMQSNKSMINQISNDEKRRLVVSILTCYHGGRTLRQLNSRFFFIYIFSSFVHLFIHLYIFITFLIFSGEYKEHVGQQIADTALEAEKLLETMHDVILFEGRYITTSEKSAHVYRRLH